MNIGLFRKPKLSTVLTTLYFIGVVISACVLQALQLDSTPEALVTTYRICGVTFFTGLVALYFTATARIERVVYLNRKEEKTTSQKQTVASQSLIDRDAVSSIIESQDNVPQRVLNEICNRVGAGQGAIYTRRNGLLELTHGYALGQERLAITYNLGEGIVGRVAAEGQRLCLDDLPKGYITVYSGLGKSSPSQLVVAPVKFDDQVKGVIEIASLAPLNEQTLDHIEECAGAIATTIY